MICFESPHRLPGALKDVAEAFGEGRPIALGRELTKRFEEVIRGNAAELAARFETERPRGEFTMVLGGKPKRLEPPEGENLAGEDKSARYRRTKDAQ